jgi:hypothetical protein
MTVLPVAAVCTASRLREFLITRYSLEQYHACRWVVMSDPSCHEYFGDEAADNVVSIPNLVEETAHPQLLAKSILLLKMKAMRACIESHGAAWHLDSDLLFVHPLPGSLVDRSALDAEVVVTEHHTRPEITEKYGRFNGGMLFTRSLAFVDAWQGHTEARPPSVAVDQKALEALLVSGRFRWTAAPAGCNFGWWRFENDRRLFRDMDLHGGVIRYRDEPIVNFHFHIDRRIRRPLERVFGQLVAVYLSNSTEDRHRDLLEKIRQVFGQGLRA